MAPPRACAERSILQPGHLIRLQVGLEYWEALLADVSNAHEAFKGDSIR